VLASTSVGEAVKSQPSARH